MNAPGAPEICGDAELIPVALIDDRETKEIQILREFMREECSCRLDHFTEIRDLKDALSAGQIACLMVNYSFRGNFGGYVLQKIKKMGFDHIPMAMFNSDRTKDNEARTLFNAVDFSQCWLIHDINSLHDTVNRLKWLFRRRVDTKLVNPSPWIFLIHGHHVSASHRKDGQPRKQPVETALERISRLLEHNLQVRTRIIKEDHVDGTTLIQAIEGAMREGSLAIVLLTADDCGRLRSDSHRRLELRARENVLFEAGLARGRLGEARTILLKEKAVVLPSDFGGLHYYSLEDYSDAELALKLTQILLDLQIPFSPRI